MRVYTTEVFDILHRGHLNILIQAAPAGCGDSGTMQFYFEARRGA